MQALVSPSRVWGLHRESVEGLEQRPDMVRFACFETALSAVGRLQEQETGEVGGPHTRLLSLSRENTGEYHNDKSSVL